MSQAKNEEQNISYAGCLVKTETQKHNSAGLPNAKKVLQIINDSQLIYSEGWEFSRIMPRNMKLLNNTCASSGKAGATAQYTFERCTRIQIFKTSECTEAVAGIILDGTPAETIDCAKLESQLLFDSGTLANGSHTIQITVVNGTLTIDRIEGWGAPPKRITIGSRNRDFAHYTCGFTPSGNFMTADDEGEECEFYFMGPSVALCVNATPDGGFAELFLNGQYMSEIDCYSPIEKKYIAYKAQNLSDRSFNCLKIRLTGKKNAESKGTRVMLCNFIIENGTTVITEMNRQTDLCLEQMAAHQRTYQEQETWQKQSFDGRNPIDNVILHGGLFKEAAEKNIRYLLESVKLPGWVDIKDSGRIWIDMLVASNEGRMLGGMGNTLRFMQVEEFNTFIKDLLAVIERRQFTNMNGYCLPYESSLFAPSKETWPGIMRDEIRNYDRTMFTKGLLAAGYAGFPEAFEIVRKFYDWFNTAYTYLPNMLTGSMGVQGSAAGPRVYHSPVGVPQDIITNMKYYDMEWWLSYLDQGIPEAVWRFPLNRPHNYKLTSICALFDIYKATGDIRYLNASKGAWRIYREYFRLTGGGITICEHFECLPKTHNISSRPHSIYETCASVFWIELNNRLLQMEPENQTYAEEIEESIYNFMFSCQGTDGRIRYFNHMNGKKEIPGRYNTCCEIQATAFFGMMPEYIYMLRNNGISVNLFVHSEIKFEHDNSKFVLRTETDFPFDDKVNMEIETETGGEFTLYIRIPAWSKEKAVIFVNGSAFCSGDPDGYAAVKRYWKNGDTICFKLSKSLRREKYNGMHRIDGYDRYAFMYGPLLMAVKGELTPAYRPDDEQSICFDNSIEEFMNRLQHKEGLVFQEEGGKYQLIPYFYFHEGEFTCFPGFKK